MKTLTSFVFALILMASQAFGAIQCGSAINDQAGVLGSQVAQVEQAVNTLDSKGADARVITTNDFSGSANLDAYAEAVVGQCPSWQAPNGKAKTTLALLMVSPQKRQMGIYVGKAIGPAFSGAWINKYRTEYMGPHFAAGEWAQGFIVAMNQMSARLATYNSAANAQTTNTTVNQATDLHGLWWVLWGILGLVLLGIIIVVYKARQAAIAARKEAQANAITACDTVAKLISDIRQLLPDTPTAQMPSTIRFYVSRFDNISTRYSQLAGSISGDPRQNDGTRFTYQSLEAAYSGIASDLENIQARIKDGLENPDQEQDSSKSSWVAPAVQETAGQSAEATPTPTPAAPAPSTTVIVDRDNSGSDFAAGMVAGSMLHSEPTPVYEDPSRSYEAPVSEPDPEPESSSFSDDSGSSSSEDDDSSSSFSDSSSSSSFDSGSSSFDSGSFSSDSGSSSF